MEAMFLFYRVIKKKRRKQESISPIRMSGSMGKSSESGKPQRVHHDNLRAAD